MLSHSFTVSAKIEARKCGIHADPFMEIKAAADDGSRLCWRRGRILTQDTQRQNAFDWKGGRLQATGND